MTELAVVEQVTETRLTYDVWPRIRPEALADRVKVVQRAGRDGWTCSKHSPLPYARSRCVHVAAVVDHREQMAGS